MNRRTFGQSIMRAAQASAPAAAASTQKFSVMLWALGRTLPLERRLEIVAEAGYNGGELTTEWRTWSADERKRMAAKAASLNLTFDLMFPSTAALTDPAQRTKLGEEIKQAIPVAQEIRCPQFGFRSGPRIAGQSPEQQKQSIVDGLKVAVDLCREHKIEVILEPIDLIEAKNEAVNSVTEALAITREVNDPSLKVLYDFYHEQRGVGNLIDTLQKNIADVGLVHIADVPGRHYPGTGEMNYTNIYRALAALHYNRYICMEFLPLGDPLAELKTARQQAIAALQSA
jgi:hydroxypyruvate isomerase